MHKNIFKPIVILVFSLFISQLSHSQINTLYFMDGIHQSNSLNPAYQSNCNGFVALPALSGIYMDFSNTGFDFNDIIHQGTGVMKDSLIIDINKLKSKLGKSNYLMAGLHVPIVGFGFWVRNSYFTFEMSNKTRGRISYPKDLIKLIDGNSSYIGYGNPMDIKDLGPDFFNYYDFSFGLSRQITHRLTVGAKLKVLAGTVSIESRKSSLKLFTEENSYNMRLTTDIRLNISAPLDFEYDENGLISNVDFDDSNITSSVAPGKNMGLGIDLGAIYQFNDEIKLHASVTDLGFIRWKNNTVNISQSGSFDFTGFTLDSAFANSDYSEAEALADSISDFFTFSQSGSKFTTFLSTNVYLGGTYEMTNYLNFGFLSRTFFYDRKIHQAFTLSANFKPTKWFTGSLSYSMMNREYKNLGIGLGFKAGPVQFYLLTDNLNAALWPKSAKTVGLQFGLNLYFGCGKRDNFSMIKNKKSQKEVDFM